MELDKDRMYPGEWSASLLSVNVLCIDSYVYKLVTWEGEVTP